MGGVDADRSVGGAALWEMRSRRLFFGNDEETLGHARAGHCVARELPDESELPVTYLGEPTNVPQETPQQEEAWRTSRRELEIDKALKNLSAPRCCPKCDYPVPSWRTTAGFVGLRLGVWRRVGIEVNVRWIRIG